MSEITEDQIKASIQKLDNSKGPDTGPSWKHHRKQRRTRRIAETSRRRNRK